MVAMMFWYIKGKVQKICQDDPHLPMELVSEAKSKDDKGGDNMMRVWIARNWNEWKSEYKKEKSGKTEIN